MLRWGSHQYNLKRNWSLVFLFLFRVSTAEMDTWVAPGFLIVQEKATKPIITSDAPLWSPQPDPLCDCVTCPGSACLLYTEVCESKMDKTVWTMIFSPFTQQRNSGFFSGRLKTALPSTINGGYCGSHRNSINSFAFIVGSKCPKENSMFSCFQSCWCALFETAHSAASGFDRIYSLGEKMSSQANTRAGLHSSLM